MVKKITQKLYIALMFIFLYAPIAVLIVLSFNKSKSRAKWGGFTLQWYKELFANQQIMNALYTTLVLALVSALVATIIGTAASIAMNSMRRSPRTIMMGITNIPMLNADIVTGISLMLIFVAINYTLGFTSVLIAHITFNIPYVILSVMPKLKQTNKSTYEAALDLGASHMYAFRTVILPDIFPGIMSGFLLAFTMSLDDFIITHFTKGPGVNTLSTKIYTEVRKGIKPEMYALSTLLFVSVLTLLILINRTPSEEKINKRLKKKAVQKESNSKFRIFKPAIILIVIAALIVGSFAGMKTTSGKNTLNVYNWGEYIDPEVITMFEKETGIDVVYDEFEMNEEMYSKVETGAVKYDVVCPSDYTIQRMIEADLLAELNYDNIPNIKYIGKDYLQSAEAFDPGNKYAIPYCWGTVGILYNKTMVDEPIDSWSAIFDEKYKNNILMINSVRDAMGIALKYLGYSLNSTDRDELEEATNLLKEQKPLVQSYVVDQVRDKMIGNNAAIGIIYSGEAIYTRRENPDLEYVVPKEGSNIWIDGWVIPKNSENKENAEKFINFLCRPDIALLNFDYITYSTPNTAARDLIEDEDIRNSTIAFPDSATISNCETFKYLGDAMTAYYDDKWREVLSQ
ncbi:spermidine/putrescine transport system permease protein [Anaerosporobacter mobilis DSM 15930]|uniref:Spermidine/putrescine transport system permease protein n=1 Tax=Anaerosporobacter mobilis DSM 15930 TaxID=1120996 RepID=A0A1M7MUI7_9FIRM|nr:extracellular solute-binding protein [Anaerosporobacter mobilis]SHM94766.1 spermidine/putrescine transport system permease protein [Anaerosporobacter mobilis DSM 15930]